MSDPNKPSALRNALLITVVAGGAAFALVAAIWAVGPTAYSQTNPYADDVAQNPTGAGSNPDGVVSVTRDGVIQHEPADEYLESTAATDVNTVSSRDADDTVVDKANRLLEPSEANSADTGQISDRTGTVQTN